MKKTVICFIAVTVTMFVLSFTALSAGGEPDSFKDTYSFSDLTEGLSDETLEILKETGLDEISFDSVFSVSPLKIFDLLFSVFTKEIKEPLKFFAEAVGIYILLSVMTVSVRYKEVFKIISMSVLCVFCAVPVSKLVNEVFSVIETVCAYNTVLSGILCGVVSASGGVVSGSLYGGMSVFFFNIISKICEIVSNPLINGMCFFSFMSCFNGFSLSGKISEMLKKAYMFFLGGCGSVFTGILSLKTVLSSSADSVTLRSVKFMVGESLPLVGGVISESCSAISASLSLLKNTVGVFGIVSVIITVLPVLIKLVCWQLSFSCVYIFGEMISFNDEENPLSSFKTVITLLFATVIFAAAVFIVSVGTVIVFSGGAKGI